MQKHKLFILPGWSMDESVWGGVLDTLSDKFELYFCDWHGLKTAEAYKTRVFNFIEEKVDGDFSVLGWSLGSLLATLVACQYSSRTKHLILVSGTSRFTRDKKSGYLFGVAPSIVEKMKSVLLQDQQKTLESFYTSMFSEEEIMGGYDEKFEKLKNQLYCKIDEQELLAGLDYLIQTDLREKLQEIKAPLLLIHGEKDTICPVLSSRFISEKVKTTVKLEIIEGAGHIPFFTREKEFTDLIINFIKREI